MRYFTSGRFEWRVPLLGVTLAFDDPAAVGALDWWGVNYYTRRVPCSRARCRRRSRRCLTTLCSVPRLSASNDHQTPPPINTQRRHRLALPHVRPHARRAADRHGLAAVPARHARAPGGRGRDAQGAAAAAGRTEGWTAAAPPSAPALKPLPSPP